MYVRRLVYYLADYVKSMAFERGLAKATIEGVGVGRRSSSIGMGNGTGASARFRLSTSTLTFHKSRKTGR